jgi:predicted RNase H-like HicB family nuclease
MVKRYLIVIEETGSGYAAYSPDLPGCVSATGPRHEIENKMKEAIAFHLAGGREEGQEIPEPHTFSTYIDLPARSFKFSVMSFKLHPLWRVRSAEARNPQLA